MKLLKIFVIAISIIALGCRGTRQTENKSVTTNKGVWQDTLDPVKMRNDTIRYLQNEIVTNKQKYIGKPLEMLLKNMKYEVKFYIVATSILPDPKKDTIRGIGLYFHSQKEYNEMNDHSDARRITVMFNTSLVYQDILPLKKKYHDNWSPEIREFYGKLLISDLLVPGLLLK